MLDDGAVAQAQPASKPEMQVAAETPRSSELEKEIAAVKAENAAVREQLSKAEEQQKVLLEMIDRLERRLDGAAAADAQSIGKPSGTTTTNDASVTVANAAVKAPQQAANAADAPAQSAPVSGNKELHERYQDGIIIWQTSNDAIVPFLLRFNVNTQVRYLNTTSSKDTFTDHLGVVRDVTKRDDITVNRSMFILGGYIFNPRLRYSSTVWTSAGAASIVVAGTIGWQFSKAITLTGGYTGIPGSRSLVNTFPFFTATDRSMADNFFRPGFTQGIWANGEPIKGLNYLVFVGNGLNTLNISASKIDTNLMYSGSVWWEPLGDYGEPGKSRNMYDDYFASNEVRIRIGSAFTKAREDRFSDLDQSNPENTSMHNSDGVLTFSTGAFAPGVTVQEATYKMWAIDAGVKWNGLALNGQYFFRWLNHFTADGPLPLSSTYDRGFELSASYFFDPKKWAVYARGSAVSGQFGDSWEYALGAKWYFVPTERMWLAGELMRVNKSPYSGTFTPYTSGLTGWVPMVQAILAF
jgi:hypothetical protein